MKSPKGTIWALLEQLQGWTLLRMYLLTQLVRRGLIMGTVELVSGLVTRKMTEKQNAVRTNPDGMK